ncbi:MAG: MerR family transcriptional regulator [Paludibacter sp.]|jgi:DNA-binding transcriptional MerR regulator|nr:MerR family transcriptional regulator [Paludibacter sp.]
MEKHFYSISEVAEMLGINQSNLRFWEKEFKQLRPRRYKGGTRFYTAEDIATVKQIKYLVDVQKLTLDGVRQKLATKKDEVSKQQELIERLQAVRSDLKGLLRLMDNSNQ